VAAAFRAGFQIPESEGDIRSLTRNFEETKQSCIKKGPAFRNELLQESVECLLAGDLETGQAILRDYINATAGFEKLSNLTRKPAKSLMHMFGPKGNPRARNLRNALPEQFTLPLRFL
jgi:hypothetical protein